MSYTVLNLCETMLLKELIFLTRHKLDKPIRWLHVAELSASPEELLNQLKPDDLLIVMGPFLNDDPGMLMHVIDIAADKGLSAVLLYNGVLSQGIPESVISFADRKQVTLLTLPGKNPAITDLTSLISLSITEYNHSLPEFLPFHMLTDIIHGDYYDDKSVFLMRAQSLGFDLSVPHRGICVHVTPRRMTPPSRSNKVHNREWMECADSVLSRYYKQPYLKSNSEPDSYFLVPKTYVDIEVIAKQILESCQTHDTDQLFHFQIGIGSLYPDPEGFTKTMKESRQVVEILELMGRTDEYCLAPDILLSLLVREERDNPLLYHLYEANIQPLLEMDISEKNDLLKTLEAYFENGMNISQAADAIYVHRNTMRSRLENISNLTRRDLKDPLDRLELQLALHYYKINIRTVGLIK